jgi:hypothetical protein
MGDIEKLLWALAAFCLIMAIVNLSWAIRIIRRRRGRG